MGWCVPAIASAAASDRDWLGALERVRRREAFDALRRQAPRERRTSDGDA